MAWNIFTTIEDAMEPIPRSSAADPGYSTPDVYGRPVQFFLTLHAATEAQNSGAYDNDETLAWRGILSLLALRHFLDLPLEWQVTTIPHPAQQDPFSQALLSPPRDKRQLIFPPDNGARQWDGSTFYVLKWAPEGIQPVDLAIYSPLTLIYPVENWREAFRGIRRLERFFDKKAGGFRGHQQLLGAERNLVYLWLKDVHQALNSGDDAARQSKACSAINQHLTRFMDDLQEDDPSIDLLTAENSAWQWRPFPEYDLRLSEMFPPLIHAYTLGYPVFSDQICYFQVEDRPGDQLHGNLFSACEYSAKYRVEDTHKANETTYAFLPVHPNCQESCRDHIVLNMRMRFQLLDDQEFIQAATSINVGGKTIPLIRNYRLEDEMTAEKDVAVCYDKSPVQMNTWPLISIWPTTIGETWNKYYIMRTDSNASLKIAGETAGQSGLKLERGNNNSVVRIDGYVPWVIPLERLYDGDGGTRIAVSVGIVTPKISASASGARQESSATVAVDFGTSSTRIFYTLNGQDEPQRELIVARDEPLEVTAYRESPERCNQMSVNFISPDAQQTSLLSVFRRSSDQILTNIYPFLEGVIYQPSTEETTGETKRLITNLKWNDTQFRGYHQAFMQQLCLHVTAMLYRDHNVTNITWRYALPESMKPEQREWMHSLWKKKLIPFLESMSSTIAHEVNECQSESHASSKYFATYQKTAVHPEIGYLVADIGGGSTDVALWQNPGDGQLLELKWHDSVTVAGRKMFTQWVNESLYAMAQRIQDEEFTYIIKQMKMMDNDGSWAISPDPELRNAIVDRLLTMYNSKLKTAYRDVLVTAPDGWGKELNGRITQAVTLLMYSLGYQVGHLMQRGRFVIPEGRIGFFAIAVGGRGSNVLDWLGNHDFDAAADPSIQNNVIAPFFRYGVAAAGASWPDSMLIQVVKSPDPKCEVARGLLVNAFKCQPPEALNADMENRNYFIGSANQFRDQFSQFQFHFPAKQLTQAEQAELAGFVPRNASGENDIFRCLMETIYGYLETKPL